MSKWRGVVDVRDADAMLDVFYYLESMAPVRRPFFGSLTDEDLYIVKNNLFINRNVKDGAPTTSEHRQPEQMQEKHKKIWLLEVHKLS